MQPPKGKQRGVRVVEGARLESVYTGNRIEGSNPFLSAVFFNRVSLHLPKGVFHLDRIMSSITIQYAESLAILAF